MPEPGPASSASAGGRRPGRRGRRVVAPPTGAPGEDVEQPVLREPGPRAAGPADAAGAADAEDARRWAAEAERLRADRPPHWG